MKNQGLSIKNKLKCVIFDMDGLLVDTESLRYKAYNKVFKDCHYNFSENDYSKYWVNLGTGLDGFLDNNKKIKIIEKKLLILKKQKYFIEMIYESNLKSIDGVVRLLKILKENNIKIALATSSSRYETIIILKKIKLYSYFNIIVTKDDVKNKKPHTEMYEYILKKMKLSPSNCITIEDAEKGIIPSIELKIKTIAIPNNYTINNDFKNTNLILKSIKQLNIKKLRNLLLEKK